MQRKTIRFCSNNYQPTDSVIGKSRDLGRFSLGTRRTTARLNLMYKIYHGTVDVDKNNYLRPQSNYRAKTCSSYYYQFLKINATQCVFLSLFSTYIKDVGKTTERHLESNSLEKLNTNISRNLTD